MFEPYEYVLHVHTHYSHWESISNNWPFLFFQAPPLFHIAQICSTTRSIYISRVRTSRKLSTSCTSSSLPPVSFNISFLLIFAPAATIETFPPLALKSLVLWIAVLATLRFLTLASPRITIFIGSPTRLMSWRTQKLIPPLINDLGLHICLVSFTLRMNLSSSTVSLEIGCRRSAYWTAANSTGLSTRTETTSSTKFFSLTNSSFDMDVLPSIAKQTLAVQPLAACNLRMRRSCRCGERSMYLRVLRPGLGLMKDLRLGLGLSLDLGRGFVVRHGPKISFSSSEIGAGWAATRRMVRVRSNAIRRVLYMVEVVALAVRKWGWMRLIVYSFCKSSWSGLGWMVEMCLKRVGELSRKDMQRER